MLWEPNLQSTKMSSFHLDTTLEELYGLDKEDPRDIYLSYTIPAATLQMTQGIPISQKYIYQDTLAPENLEIQVRIFTQMAPQLFGFMVWSLSIIIFDLDAPDGGINLQPQVGTQDVLSCITESQRPIVSYVRSVEDANLPPDVLLAVANSMNCLEHIPSPVSFENRYRVLSKRDLVVSGLSTPGSIVVETRSLTVQEMLSASAVAIALFLSREGEVMVTSVCDQFVDAQGNWGGGHVDYAGQERLSEKYRAL
ncbi:hypothetical protein BOTNAR_0131g00200 [Botryotinia narcissicola]|uniref:Uncharacterized protein n=1 Tax=Botryotinia narcissicola TaxID=278944 RepID=A0A4Z1IL67_9HELO|nr:hypothetical protein BOTNAR_0131g00200 [Botryotinia narcissicola]